MGRHLYCGMLLITLTVVVGCFSDDARNGRNQAMAPPPKLPAASEVANTRTYTVFSKLVFDNPDVGTQLAPNNEPNYMPKLQVVGSPGVSIYHTGQTLYITQGLVNRCTTDGKNESQLAAVLASELAKMVIENDYQKQMRNGLSEADRTFSPHVTSESVYADKTDLATIGFGERDNARKRDPVRAMPNIDPNVLARNYLSKANFSPDELLRMSPLIKQAENDPELQKQINPARGWSGLGLK